MRDLHNFNKLSKEKQDKIIENMIKQFPKEKQAQLRKELLVK